MITAGFGVNGAIICDCFLNAGVYFPLEHAVVNADGTIKKILDLMGDFIRIKTATIAATTNVVTTYKVTTYKVTTPINGWNISVT